MALEALAHRSTARQAARLEHRSFQVAAFRDMASHEMELVGMALQGADELHRIAALREHAIESAVERHKLAVEGGGDDVVDADGGGVAQHGDRIVERHGLAAVAFLVEQELVDLAAALAAIAAQPLDDPVERLALDAEPAGARRTLDQPFESGLVVHVTGQGR